MKSFSLLFFPEILSFPLISIFQTLSNYTQITQLIEVVKQKIFQTWEYYPQNWSNMQRGLYLSTVKMLYFSIIYSLTISSVLVFNETYWN